MNRGLRMIRIVVSATLFLLLTAGMTLPVAISSDALIFTVLERIQFVPAVMGFSLFIFVVWLILTLVFGRIYCSSVCPVGTLQDIASRAVRLCGRRTYRYSKPQSRLRIVMLLVMLVCLLGQYYVAVSVLDPYGAYARICTRIFAPMVEGAMPLWNSTGVRMSVAIWGDTLLAVVTFGVVVLIAARRGRLVCNTVCPVGTTLGIVSRFSIFQIDIDTDKCVQCGRCEEVCRGQCIDLTDHVVDGSRCVNCFDCLTVCPNDAIHYTSRRKQLSEPMMQRIPDAFGRQDGATLGKSTGNACSETNKLNNDETIS